MNKKIAIIGLGYVGLPLAVEFGKKYQTVGYDTSISKISHYMSFNDPMGQVTDTELRSSKHLIFSSNPLDLQSCDLFIIAVPTPVNSSRAPDLTSLIEASTTVAKSIKKGAIIVYESTVYPGATEEICIPILEKYSNLKWKKDFSVGYSPERVNPGDKVRTLTDVVKVVSADSDDCLGLLVNLYSSIIRAGIHKATSIKVAEASKVIENTQRDLNIALINELAIIFHKLNIDTSEVLAAAESKWNFLPFKPGLVGGHCIGVDPYYLTHKAEMLGYHPEVILAGRRINDGMSQYIANATVQQLMHNGGCKIGDNIIILGATFKENCADIRNSKVFDIAKYLIDFGFNISIHDPIANSEEVNDEYGISLTDWDNLPSNAHAIIAAVAHDQYLQMPINEMLKKLKNKGVFVDIKSLFNQEKITSSGHTLWRL